MGPLSWGMVHPDVITIQAMLKDAGFDVPDINMDAYMEARRLTQSFIDEFLGYFIDPGNKIMTSLLVGCGLPGGMMGSMMSDLKGMHNAINLALRQHRKKEVPFNDLVVQLFREVEYVWPKLGYPPLVTPFSQYVKNIALMNILSLAKDEPRFSMIDKDSWNMILGKTGQLPGPLAPEITELAKKNGLEFYTGDPQAAFPNELDRFRADMKAKGWDVGKDEEELFEYAMHERQYLDYRSGVAKERFDRDLEVAKEKTGAPIVTKRPVIELPKIEVEKVMESHPKAQPVHAPVRGQILWTYEPYGASVAPEEGSAVKEGDALCFVQAFYGVTPVKSNFTGKIVTAYAKQGDMVEKGEIIAFVE
jgi:pyruvate carboxylase subunit B